MRPASAWRAHLHGLASLVLPPAVAWAVAFRAPHPTELSHAVVYALGPLGLAVAAALVFRAGDALASSRPGSGRGSWLEAADVLTASGRAMSFWSAAAIALSVWVGWASLAVVGLLGLGTLHLLVLWTLLRAGGPDPWRAASLSRRFSPPHPVEGDVVTEELFFDAPRIPAGMRLLARGRVGARWLLSRYALESSESAGGVLFKTEIGPALRGEHDVAALTVWLQDVLGMTRSRRVLAGASSLTVLPRPRAVEGVMAALRRGGDDDAPRPERRLPTEGSLDLREYRPGDDTRRVHWVRSLAAGKLVVRMPDEVPPRTPGVVLVLDTFVPDRWDVRLPTRDSASLAGVSALTCHAPAELLDGLVGVWLGVGRALAERGKRVTLVTALRQGGGVAKLRQGLSGRGMADAQRLGAAIAWQDAIPPRDLVDDARTIVVSHRLPKTDEESAATWIVVPAELWSTFDAPRVTPSHGVLPYPMGSADNRWSRRRLERARRDKERWDHATFSVLASHSQSRRANNFVARPGGNATARLEVLT